ncbi:MAG: 2-dehydropantoate 2-reductase [Fibrobacteres bacterium]|nr:2-dehydropantoate 2-reductase [Fibrobacterota bacterium]
MASDPSRALGLTYSILGTGAVGGYYGALLQKAGRQVQFLVNTDFAQVRAHGLRVDSPKGDFRLPVVDAVSRAEDLEPADVAVIAWKTTANGLLPGVLKYALKPGGIALVLQNGLDPEREVSAAAPAAKVLSGLCFLCSRKAGPGWIQHLDYGAVSLAAFGSGSEGVTPEMRAVAEDFQAAGVDVKLLEDWRDARWRKLAWNIPFNGMCALTGKDTSALLKDPSTRKRISILMDEVIDGAAACGCRLPAGFRDRMLADTEKMIPYKPSMQLDREAGRPMELDAIYAKPLKAIAAAGGLAPAMQDLFGELSRLEG